MGTVDSLIMYTGKRSGIASKLFQDECGPVLSPIKNKYSNKGKMRQFRFYVSLVGDKMGRNRTSW
jgi:hypothetical protein